MRDEREWNGSWERRGRWGDGPRLFLGDDDGEVVFLVREVVPERGLPRDADLEVLDHGEESLRFVRVARLHFPKRIRVP